MCEFISFVEILFEPSTLRSFFFRALLVKGLNLANIKLKDCSPDFWNGHVTDIKILMFWISDFISIVQIWFEPSCFFRAVFLVGRSNLANIKLGVLQSTFLKWWRADIKMLIFWRSDFCPNLIWPMDFQEFL